MAGEGFSSGTPIHLNSLATTMVRTRASRRASVPCPVDSPCEYLQNRKAQDPKLPFHLPFPFRVIPTHR